MDDEVDMPYVRLMFGWALFGLVLGLFLWMLVGFQSSAGVLYIIALAVIFMIIAPPVNSALLKYQHYKGKYRLKVSFILTFVFVLIVFFTLANTGFLSIH